MLVRDFAPDDAEYLSRLIIRNLRRVNIRDYSSEAIEALVPFYTPDKLIQKSRNQRIIVCTDSNDLVGTASLDGDRVRNVFVHVDMHGRGIGRLLMSEIESFAQENDLRRIYLHSGLSAQGFYEKLGFATVERIERELDGNPLPEIKMHKDLSKGLE